MRRNLLAALTSALIARIMQNCSATKANCCVWNAEAQKLLVLLSWMATVALGSQRDRSDDDAEEETRASHSPVLELLLSRMTRASASKSEQLGAALVVFELVQLHRQRVREEPDEKIEAAATPLSLLGRSYALKFTQELVRLTCEGTVVLAESESGSGDHIKLTVLGLVSLEALVAVLSDYAAWYLSQPVGHRASACDEMELLVFLGGVDTALTTLQRYHASPRKQLLGLALQQLSEYVAVCRSLLAASDAGTDLSAALEMLCWHWNASAMLLCSRSEAATRVRNRTPRVVLQQWQRCVHNAKHSHSSARGELFVAGLRRVWILLSLVGNGKSPAESSDESRAFLTLLLHAFKSGIEVFGYTPFVEKRELRPLRRFLAEFVVQRSLALSSEVIGLLQSSDLSSMQVCDDMMREGQWIV